MEKESLEIVSEKIVEMLNDAPIETVEKIELLINLMHFLNPDEYENNIKVLEKKRIDSKID